MITTPKKLFNYVSISLKPQTDFVHPPAYFCHLSPDKHLTRVWVQSAGSTKSLLQAYPAHSNAYPPECYRTLLLFRPPHHRPMCPGLPGRGATSAYQAVPDNRGHSDNAGNSTGTGQPRPHPGRVCLVYPRRLALCNAKLPAEFPVYPASEATRQPVFHRLSASHSGQNP